MASTDLLAHGLATKDIIILAIEFGINIIILYIAHSRERSQYSSDIKSSRDMVILSQMLL